MKNSKLPLYLVNHYDNFESKIKSKLLEFEMVSQNQYFYELCFCICTPQSKAIYALEVQKKLIDIDFLNKGSNPIEILNSKEHYIRFHNQKAFRLLKIREDWCEILNMLNSEINPKEKRLWLSKNINGIGMKESAHFMRNIGYKNLGILDRHILKHLVLCGIYKEVPKINSQKQYEEVEFAFLNFSKEIKIPMDELDLLFWSYQVGDVFK
ncbi:MAG: DNA lyase [Candidatus Kapabacteria bacterium]|nr:DNA lyase [Candidatus Kapabacteria bacterium]